MSICWDVTLPADSKELEVLFESDKYRVYVMSDRATGDTIYQGQFKTRGSCSWWDDNDAVFYNEDDAERWYNDCINS